MTEQGDAQAEASEQVWHPHDQGSPDNLLRRIVSIVEANDDLRLPMTLVVSGTVVFGFVVSSKRWAEETGEYILLGQAPVDSLEGELTLGQGLQFVLRSAMDSERPLASKDVSHVHMRRVRSEMGDTMQELGLWRFSVDQVSGWSLRPTSSDDGE